MCHPIKKRQLINRQLKNTNIRIVIYGGNANDESISIKYQQLLKLGFTNIYIYPGGLFEWLCLQDIYGDHRISDNESRQLDILKYKAAPPKFCNKYLLDDG